MTAPHEKTLGRAALDFEKPMPTPDQARGELEQLRERLGAVVAEQRNAVDRQEQALVRLKAEVASLRGAMLGRNDDRSAIVLAVEEANARSERAASAIDEALRDCRASLMSLSDRLGGAEARLQSVSSRFEFFYDSGPMRIVRRAYLRLRGVKPR